MTTTTRNEAADRLGSYLDNFTKTLDLETNQWFSPSEELVRALAAAKAEGAREHQEEIDRLLGLIRAHTDAVWSGDLAAVADTDLAMAKEVDSLLAKAPR